MATLKLLISSWSTVTTELYLLCNAAGSICHLYQTMVHSPHLFYSIQQHCLRTFISHMGFSQLLLLSLIPPFLKLMEPVGHCKLRFLSGHPYDEASSSMSSSKCGSVFFEKTVILWKNIFFFFHFLNKYWFNFNN